MMIRGRPHPSIAIGGRLEQSATAPSVLQFWWRLALVPFAGGNCRGMSGRFCSLHAMAWAGCLALLGPASAHAAELAAGFTEETLLRGINAGTAIATVPDGRVLIAEQTGKLKVLKNDKELPVPMLDLSERVDSYWERGLVGVAVHPDFPRTPHLFALYVAARPYPHHVLSRFTVVGDVVEMESEQILLEGDDQSKRAAKVPAGHQGGPLRFGPDGRLYVAIGEPVIPTDGGCTSQQLDSLSGKILRLNTDGSIPEDNPFFARTTGKYRSIWAIGLRNPFGLAFQPESGRLLATDVGQSSFEEVNEIVRGGDYGWPQAEGMTTNAAFQNPLHAYPPVIGRSIVGGTFCPPDGAFPPEWRGKFFFADWAAHWIKALDPAAPDRVTTFAKNLNAPAALEFAPDGSLLVLNRGTIWRDGKKFTADSGTLVRIRPGSSGTVPASPPMPGTLADAGLCKSLSPLVLTDSFTPVEIAVEPWQPGVKARRWIAMPRSAKMKVDAEGRIEFPKDTIIVQHFDLEKSGTAFETHVFWFTGPRVARAAAYRWSGDGTRATLVEHGGAIPLPDDPKRFWFSPGGEKQLMLDLAVAGFVLPVTPAQLHCDDQLQRWIERGWLDALPHDLPRPASIDDTRAPPELRVRSYLDANCAVCHRPGGPSRGDFDARITTPLSGQNLIHGPLMAGDLGIAGARLVVPGQPEKSILLQRVKRVDAFRMPQTNLNHEPQPILPLLEEWIRSLK